MAFMKPVAQKLVMYHVETDIGTELVPEDVCGVIEIEDDEPCDNGLEAFIKGSEVHSVERKEGFYSRLSADGYLDCTDWMGPYKTSEKALAAVKKEFEVDDNGDSYDHIFEGDSMPEEPEKF